MPEFLILRLRGVMQAWGGHTYEDYRPSHNFPTRSGIEGLLAACLGIDREDKQAQSDLASSIACYAVRSDDSPHAMRKITDFHTVMAARKVDGKANQNPVISRREYLCDRQFTVALAFADDAVYSLQQVVSAVQKPYYTPVLGRRSCPLTAPLFVAIQQAEGLHQSLQQVPPNKGTIYSELPSQNRIEVRDRRLFADKRRFDKREVYIHGEVANVSE